MTKSNSIQSYPHCKEIWDAAYASQGSIFVQPRNMSQSELVGDLLHYRMLVRKENSKFYPPGHPEHMTSIFDPFKITKVNGGIRIRRRQPADYEIVEE